MCRYRRRLAEGSRGSTAELKCERPISKIKEFLNQVAAKEGMVRTTPYANIRSVHMDANTVLSIEVHHSTCVRGGLNGRLLAAQELCLLVDKQVEASIIGVARWGWVRTGALLTTCVTHGAKSYMCTSYMQKHFETVIQRNTFQTRPIYSPPPLAHC